MKDSNFVITENKALTGTVFKMVLSGDVSAITAPGQFVNLRIDGLYLRRPISVYDIGENTLSLIYKVVGKGTEKMSAMQSGDSIAVLTGLGNGYSLSLSGDRPLLIGGGVGIPPLYLLAKRLISEGKKVSVILGFNNKDEVFCEEDFIELGADVSVTTVDGSYGIRGFVTNAIKEGYTHFYTCGPEPMLRAVYTATDTDGQFSFEERMGCGFGACMGCSCKTISGEGPVLTRGEILWED